MPALIRLKTQEATDLGAVPAGKVDIFVDDDTLEPSYKIPAGTVISLKGDPGADAALTGSDEGNTGASVAIDADAFSIQRHVMNGATVAYTLATAETAAAVRINWTQDGTGGRVLDHPVDVDFGAEGEPTLPTAPGTVYPIDYYTIDSGTTWIAITPHRAGPAGDDGVDGVAGGAISIPYEFSTTTTDSDPGAGVLRLSNATQTSATVIRADLLASDGTDWSAVLATLAASTNSVKGHIRLFKTDDPTKWLVFSVSALASPSGYKNITVVNIAGSSSSPFSNGDDITLCFTRAGDAGSAGSVGSVLEYVEQTSAVNVTAVDGVSTTNIISGAGIALDGSTDIAVEIFFKDVQLPNLASGNYVAAFLYDGATSLGVIGLWLAPASVLFRWTAFMKRELRGANRPSAATHTYHVKAVIGATGTGVIQSGAGGTGNPMPSHMKITVA